MKYTLPNASTGDGRISMIIRYLRIKQKEFAKAIGCGESTIYGISSGSKPLTKHMAKCIHRHYPQFNLQWLIDGTGPMLDTNPEISAQIPQKKVADGEDNTIGDLQDRLRDKEYIIQLQKQRIEQLEQQLEKEKVRSESHSTSPALSPNQ